MTARRTAKSLSSVAVHGLTLMCLGSLMIASLAAGARTFVPEMTWRLGGRGRTALCSNSAEGADIPPLRYLGDPDLMQPQPEVEAVQAEGIQYRLQILRQAMAKYGGIGIAAPQIGWWVRAMCFGIEDGNPRYPAAAAVPFQYWVNPEIIWSSAETSWMWEGCLSVPGMRGWVERPREIRMRGLDEQGEPRAVHFKDLPARIAQHEFDHLEGILFPLRVESTKFLVPQAVFDGKDGWAEGWPTAGSYRTRAGDLSLQK